MKKVDIVYLRSSFDDLNVFVLVTQTFLKTPRK